jgi:PTS system nitrogen regulatory IIA component
MHHRAAFGRGVFSPAMVIPQGVRTPALLGWKLLMDVRRLLDGPRSILVGLRAPNKKQALLEIAARAGEVAGVHPRQAFDVVFERERLGSTGVGGGVAVPHGRIPGLASVRGVLAHLAEPIDFEAIDGRPVDLLFLLLTPAEAGADHLKALAGVSRLLRQPETVAKLRSLETPDAVFGFLTDFAAAQAA